jgi:SAM-dependent methyltransferase
MTQNDLHGRESSFHDSWAASLSPAEVRVRSAFECPTALENKWILSRIGDLKGKRLLDIGAGLGESAVYFALKGAKVTATDLSPGMVDFAAELGRHHGVVVESLVSPAESLDVSSGYFDIVYSANTLHHISDRSAFFSELDRVLKPGGCFFTWDPVAYNPVINVYRRMASAVRTEDERPLKRADILMARRYFPHLKVRFFWIFSLALFCKYFLWDKVAPNQQRYWKLIYQETDRSLWWWRPLASVDNTLTRIPLIRNLAWNVVLHGHKPPTPRP